MPLTLSPVHFRLTLLLSVVILLVRKQQYRYQTTSSKRRSGGRGAPNVSRSKLFSDALGEYLSRHTSDDVTEAMNRVCIDVGVAVDEFTASAARDVLKRVEW